MKTPDTKHARTLLAVGALLCATLAAQEEAVEAPLEPARARLALKKGPDFAVALYASEPEVAGPVALDWDPRRRPWVARADGSLVVLLDTDGDGGFDRAQPFADGLTPFRAFAFHRDGVVLAQGRELVHLRDTDADGRADERVTLFRGLDAERVTGLRRGLDGWIYAGVGLHGSEPVVTDAAGDPVGAVAAGVARFRPDGSAFELFAASGAAPGGLDVGWDGEVFFASTGGTCHVVLPEGLVRRARSSAATGWARLRAPAGTRAAVGSVLYAGGSWREEFYGNHFACRPEERVVEREVLQPRGVTYASTPSALPFLASSDPWFRPVGLRVGPGGSLFVLDASDGVAPAPGHGRIWRVDHQEATPVPPLALDGDDPGVWIAALEHPGAWHRETALRLLAERELGARELDLLVNLGLNTLDPRARIHALWALRAAAPRRLEELSEALLSDYRPTVRAAVVDAAGSLDRWQVLRLGHRLEARLEDPSPRVRLAALRALPAANRRTLVQRLVARYPQADPWTATAILAYAVEAPVVFLEEAFAAADPRTDPLVAHVAETIGRAGDVGGAVGLVAAAAEYRNRAPNLVGLALASLAGSLDPSLRPWASPNVSGTLRRLLQTEHAEVGLGALPLAMQWISTGELRPAIAALVARAAALAVHERTPEATRASCLRALASLADEPYAVTDPLGLSPSWPAALLHGLEQGLFAAPALGPRARARLRELEDPALAARARTALGAEEE